MRAGGFRGSLPGQLRDREGPLRSFFATFTPSATAFLLLALVLLPAFVVAPDLAWHRDWSYFQHLADVGQLALSSGTWPDYNPWHCGGFVAAGNPQGIETHPAFGLVWLFGPELGLRLAALAVLALGGAGAAWALVRLGLQPLAATMGAVLWGLAPFFSVHLSEGHVPFATLSALLPAAVAFPLALREKASADSRWLAAVGGLWVGGSLLFGGIYCAAFSAIAWGLSGVVHIVTTGQWRRVAETAGIGGIVAFVMAAPRLIPAAVALSAMPRDPIYTDGLELDLLVRALTSREVSTAFVEGHPYDWPEYALYPGFVLVALAVAGGIVAGRRRLLVALPWFVAGAALALGKALGPLDELRQLLPIAGDLQVPSRYAILAVAALVLLATCALDWLLQRGGASRLVAVALAALAAGEVATLDYAWLVGAPTDREGVVAAQGPPRAVGYLKGYDQKMDEARARGLSLQPCYEPLPHPIAVSWPSKGQTPFVRTVSGAQAAVFMPHPGRFRLELPSGSDFVADLGQVYREEWTAIYGQVERGPGGVLRLRSQNGVAEVEYASTPRRIGHGLQVAGLLIWGIGAFRRRRGGAR